MIKRRENLIRLHSSPNVTRALIRKLLQVDPHLHSPFTLSPRSLSLLTKIKESRAAAIHNYLNDYNIMKKLDTVLQKIHCLTIFDNNYPPLLRSIPDPPLVLYAVGNLQLLEYSPSLSVVGTRKPSSYAYPSMKKILIPLIQEGFTLVSGMAQGVDQFAHHLAVAYNGTTIAVLGSGFHHIYPTNDIALYQRLVSKHLVLSEYPPDRPAKKFHFPERNRIISGLTSGTFVVEARVKSGSLITVDQALEQGKDVYAMPGLPGNPMSEGCHKMINDGAKLVHSHHDILEDWKEKI
ncbi:DNA-processing protein DprA [Halobacillus mangrovi]|uniref:DNA protecting protein DprA n=1 Tax=Halobacillus mangrovi TaxID=402384 RepID=A0A1W5ZW24_9BACI|nr:DNA-processing protein DprA [Halobacillus mangrovi]ARI77493.1 DNA protecting protein DprA [Halobacillus mangrovi]